MKKKKPHPQAIYIEKASGLFVALFTLLLKNRDHFKEKHIDHQADVYKVLIETCSINLLTALEQLMQMLNNLKGIAPDELKTTLQVITELHEYFKENFQLNNEGGQTPLSALDLETHIHE